METFWNAIEWVSHPIRFLVNKIGDMAVELLVLSLWIPYLVQLVERRKFRNSRKLVFQFLVRNVATKFNCYRNIVEAVIDRADYSTASREYLKAVEMRTLTDRYIETLSFALDENFAVAMPALVRRRERRLRMIMLHCLGNEPHPGVTPILEPQDELYRSEISLSGVANTMTSWAEELATAIVNLEKTLKRAGISPEVPIQTYALGDDLRNCKSVSELADQIVIVARRSGDRLRAHEAQLTATQQGT